MGIEYDFNYNWLKYIAQYLAYTRSLNFCIWPSIFENVAPSYHKEVLKL
jgi:hypothetical protein